MFYGASSFNNDISKWDVSKASTMSRMFWTATSFNQDLSSWKTSNVKDLSWMFLDASSFNNDISKWDVPKVLTIDEMFSRATSFNQDLCSWGGQLPTNANVDLMFSGATSCHTQAPPNLTATPPGPFCTRDSCQKCFETANELQDVVDTYLAHDDEAMSQLSGMYGLPIGAWCVSNIEDFSHLFDGDRNPLAAKFNEDISA
jgi:surface protein